MDKQLLIFDFDGTLIDSVPDLADATNTMLTTLGKETYSLDTIRNWVGNGSRMLVERALVGKIVVLEGELTVEEADHAEQVFFEAYNNISGSKTVAYPDVDSGLKKLKAAGYMLALVTNKPIRFVPKILQSFGWQDLFVEVLGGDSLPVKKPDPAPLLHVCGALNVTPDQAVMIGDSRNDILAGQNANMDTLGLSYGYNYGQDIRELNPTEAFDDFAALVKYLLKG
ncbi:phosphoglycolate phosphatase [Psychrobacter sp. P2G3]|uniref:phosphoglycolate phosphatase n=1 Tax=Psychrobacter sp. P2G3 TaxID=1699622 RepID=UPI00078CBD03|nr:phosphoglycolate phosphatase [Psychrobacter sp. P2G3]AMN50734.1 phosphoglycolate phosphatase [Psychrobacter sp. P2G3]